MRIIADTKVSIPIATAAASLLALVGASAIAQPVSAPEAGWAAVSRCAAIPGGKARHRCLDEVLRNAGLLTGARAAAAPVASPEAAAPTPPAPAEPRNTFGLGTSPARTARHAKPQAPAEPGRLTVTLQKVELDGEGKLVLTTSEGAVWRQVESDPIRPAPGPGQTMIIEKKSLGGFMCRPGRWAAFRCIRTS